LNVILIISNSSDGSKSVECVYFVSVNRIVYNINFGRYERYTVILFVYLCFLFCFHRPPLRATLMTYRRDPIAIPPRGFITIIILFVYHYTYSSLVVIPINNIRMPHVLVCSALIMKNYCINNRRSRKLNSVVFMFSSPRKNIT